MLAGGIIILKGSLKRRDKMTFTQIALHGMLTAFYKQNGLEIENGWEISSGVYFSEAVLTENGDIMCAYSVSERFGETVLDYIAVSDALRGRGIGAEMMERVRKKARQDGKSRVYLTARARTFFEKQGGRELSKEHPLYLKLLGECSECEQRNNTCFPCVMFFDIGE